MYNFYVNKNNTMGTVISLSKKLLFIFNPHSGKGQIKNHLLNITDRFTKANFDVTVRPSQAPLDVYNYVKSNGNKFDRIVVSGGDGTLNEAVRGLMAFPPEKRVPIGYIPTGTTNDFATTLKLPKNISKSTEIAADGKLFKCDVGKFNDTTFNYVAAFGAFTDVPYDTPQETKNILGHTAYVLEGMKRISSLPSYDVKIKFDNGEFKENVFLCMILNATSVAGLHNTKQLSNVDLTDGLFEMLVFKRPTNILEFQTILLDLMRGETSGDGYSFIKSSHFEFECNDEIKWTLDGEYGGNPKNITVDVIPSAITLLVKKD